MAGGWANGDGDRLDDTECQRTLSLACANGLARRSWAPRHFSRRTASVRRGLAPYSQAPGAVGTHRVFVFTGGALGALQLPGVCRASRRAGAAAASAGATWARPPSLP